MALVLILLAVLLLLTFVLGYALSSYVVHPKRFTIAEAEACEKEKGYWGDYDELEKTKYLVTAEDGYQLHAVYIPAEKTSQKYVIISHGYTYNWCGSVKYLHIFRDCGYHCILYDNRGHGENPPTVCTMGIQESKDLLSVIRDTYQRFGDDITIGLHGESMGAAITTMALGSKPRVAFAVMDCGYADLMNVLQNKIRTLFHLPAFLCYPASLVCRLCFGYWFGDVEPVNALRDNEIPVCLIHGEDDDFIFCQNSRRMEEATRGYAELHLFPGANHAESLVSDRERYRKIITEFMEKCEQGQFL